MKKFYFTKRFRVIKKDIPEIIDAQNLSKAKQIAKDCIKLIEIARD